jgi:hypothetical protein
MTLYFFERITENDFIGPVIVAAGSEDEAWTLQIAQDLAALPARPAIVYPSHYRKAVL